jgi:hypothetical protein
LPPASSYRWRVADKRGGNDPIAAYRIFTAITRSPEQQ